MNKNLMYNMDMQARVKGFLAANSELVDKYPRLKSEMELFGINRAELEIQVRKQTKVTTGITVDKKGSFAILGTMAINLSFKAIVWARDTNNQALVAVFTITKTKYANQASAKKLDMGKAVYAALNTNAAALVPYNITDTEIVAMADLITTCESANIAPGAETANKKTAKGTIEIIQEKIDANLTLMDGMIVGEYSKTEPNFVLGYQNSRKVENAGIRHTGISATITDANSGEAVENATLAIKVLNKTAISNMAGLAEIIKMKAGSYHITISAEGYTTELMDITVGKGKVIDLAVGLTAFTPLEVV